MKTRIDDAFSRDALKLMQSSLAERPICIVVVKQKPDPATDKDAFVFVAPANAQDAIRVSAALREAQKALIEVTKQAVLDGAKQAESLK
jgi:hypothetical protein